MDTVKKGEFFKKGIWIKQQQGCLTIGALSGGDKSVKIIPDHVRTLLEEMEADMVDALYGEAAVPFEPRVVDLDALFDELKEKYRDHPLKIVFQRTDPTPFRGDYNAILAILERMVISSRPKGRQPDQLPLMYINASLLDNHLCIIYRDSESVCRPEKIKKVADYITTRLNGEISYKSLEGEKSYFDILIPAMENP